MTRPRPAPVIAATLTVVALLTIATRADATDPGPTHTAPGGTPTLTPDEWAAAECAANAQLCDWTPSTSTNTDVVTCTTDSGLPLSGSASWIDPAWLDDALSTGQCTIPGQATPPAPQLEPEPEPTQEWSSTSATDAVPDPQLITDSNIGSGDLTADAAPAPAAPDQATIDRWSGIFDAGRLAAGA